jgi:hypothetical protein
MSRLVSQRKAVGRILRDSRCTKATAQVAHAILDRIGRVSGVSWPSFRQIAQDSNVQIRTAKREVKKLHEFGYLHIRHGGNRSRSNRHMLAGPGAETATGGSPVPVFAPSPAGGVASTVTVTARAPEPSQEPSTLNLGTPAAKLGRGAPPAPSTRAPAAANSFIGGWLKAFKARPDAPSIEFVRRVILVRELYDRLGETAAASRLDEAIKHKEPVSMLTQILRDQSAECSQGDEPVVQVRDVENE